MEFNILKVNLYVYKISKKIHYLGHFYTLNWEERDLWIVDNLVNTCDA
jgi:hypothetical protein